MKDRDPRIQDSKAVSFKMNDGVPIRFSDESVSEIIQHNSSHKSADCKEADCKEGDFANEEVRNSRRARRKDNTFPFEIDLLD